MYNSTETILTLRTFFVCGSAWNGSNDGCCKLQRNRISWCYSSRGAKRDQARCNGLLGGPVRTTCKDVPFMHMPC